MELRWAVWPPLPYRDGLTLQHRLVARRACTGPDLAIALEHPPVVTLGPRAHGADLLVPAQELVRRGVAVERTERGGLATYHGPGQLVLYPIVALRREQVRRYVALLEEAALAVVSACGLSGRRRAGQPGIWVGEVKVASVGIRVRSGIAFHGLALNLSVDCTPFSWIRPCGMTDGIVSSIQALGGRAMSLHGAAQAALCTLAAGLGATATEVPRQTLEMDAAA